MFVNYNCKFVARFNMSKDMLFELMERFNGLPEEERDYLSKDNLTDNDLMDFIKRNNLSYIFKNRLS